MADEATRQRSGLRHVALLAWSAVAVAVVGAFWTWTIDGPVALGGTDGPNNGWLVVIVAAFAAGWTKSMTRGSWIGIVGVLGASAVMAWTVIESWLDAREAAAARGGLGVLLVVAASSVLGGTAVAVAIGVVRSRRLDASAPPGHE